MFWEGDCGALFLWSLCRMKKKIMVQNCIYCNCIVQGLTLSLSDLKSALLWTDSTNLVLNMPLCISRAQSGTGKTATFSISILQCLDIQVRETQALILSPTRELATQIQKVSWDIRESCYSTTNPLPSNPSQPLPSMDIIIINVIILYVCVCGVISFINEFFCFVFLIP